jgi:hypothetical protein
MWVLPLPLRLRALQPWQLCRRWMTRTPALLPTTSTRLRFDRWPVERRRQTTSINREQAMQGLLALQRCFDFKGRSARAEYWQFAALYLLSCVIAYLLDLAFSGPYATPTLTILVWLVGIVPNLSVSVRRLHDRDRTGGG